MEPLQLLGASQLDYVEALLRGLLLWRLLVEVERLLSHASNSVCILTLRYVAFIIRLATATRLKLAAATIGQASCFVAAAA